MSPQRDNQVKSLVRAVAILKLFGLERPFWGVSEIAAELGLHKATAHRIVRTLHAEGLLAQDNVTRKYRLGIFFLERANVAARQFDIVTKARPFLRELAATIQESCFLSVVEGGQAVYIDVAECARTMKMTANLGAVAPLHCTASGKVLLAHMPTDTIDRLIATKPLEAFTRNTITEPSELRRHLADVCASGYALDQGERDERLCCIAAPVFDAMGQVVAAISIAEPASRLTDDVMPHHLRCLLHAAEAISAEQGYMPPAGKG